MTQGPGWALRSWLGGSAALGVMAGHCAARFLLPQAEQEGLASHATGGHVLDIATHRWGLGIAVGLGVIVAALLRIPLRPLWSSETQVTPHGVLFLQAGARLAVFQVAGFLTMEAVEAWLLPGGGAHFEHAPTLLLGAVAQCLAALLAAAILVLLVRTVRSIVRLRSAQEQSADTGLPSPVPHYLAPRFAVASGGATLRGPPFSA